jgi:hypothetical protein
VIPSKDVHICRRGTRGAFTNGNRFPPNTSKSRCSQNEACATPFGDDVSIFTRCVAATWARSLSHGAAVADPTRTLTTDELIG